MELKTLPPLKSRKEMLNILYSQEYGFIPPPPEKISFTEERNLIENFCAGNAELIKVTVCCTVNGRNFSFPFWSAVPSKNKKHPFIIHINFRPDIPDRYMPTEELIDNGFAVLSFNYENITADNGDFSSGLAGLIYEEGQRASCDAGKIALWAWGIERVIDYAEKYSDIFDMNSCAVCGHSRLGKAALLAGASDERIIFTYSNDSGCSGAALSKLASGETVKKITDVYPYWFCENYKKYADNEKNMPFDQHWLLAAIKPRFVLCGSAFEDYWASPETEFLNCALQKDYIGSKKFPSAGSCFLEGGTGYHIRPGKHYFSRYDWHILMKFIKMHMQA